MLSVSLIFTISQLIFVGLGQGKNAKVNEESGGLTICYLESKLYFSPSEVKSSAKQFRFFV